MEKPGGSSSLDLNPLLLGSLQALAAKAKAGEHMAGLSNDDLAKLLDTAEKIIAHEPTSEIETQQYAAALENLGDILEAVSKTPSVPRQ